MRPIFRSADSGGSMLFGLVRSSMRWWGVLLCIAQFGIADLCAAVAATPAARALWVWEDDTFQLLDREDQWDETFSFLAHQNITTVYLYADRSRKRNIIRDEPGKYRRLIAALHGRGFKVYALLGSIYLNTQEYILPWRRATATAMFKNVLRYNAGSVELERFDGVNVDIEPYLLDDWSTKRTLRAIQYLDLAAEFMRLKRQSGDALAVGPAMPFWFDGIDNITWRGKRQRLSDHAQDIYDYVAIMDYRNFAQGSDGMISHALDELEYADRTGKAVVIGVETLDTEPRKVTFYGMGQDAMEQQLGIAAAEFSAHPSFAGFAIHHLAPYRDMVDS
ncbi:MAG: hypothetical protein HY940_00640, partial [Gammaproteobacteria bacterium]|nr:hypothetical protein [Gammaproteobacteria bacterium]